MTHQPDLSSITIQFYATAAYNCSYIQGHIARSQVADPGNQMNNRLYSALVCQGFRRSGGFVYRPLCDHCQACKSIRVPVQEFEPNRSQRRALKQNNLLEALICKPHFSDAHYLLYQRYQKAKHTGGGMDQDNVDQYVEFLVNTEVNTYMVEFREHQTENDEGVLRMVSIIDQLEDGLSAVYTFYDPQEGQSYGTYNVLWQIQQAKVLGLPYVYLGYWIEACSKMSYKTRFQPCELLVQDKWQRVI